MKWRPLAPWWTRYAARPMRRVGTCIASTCFVVLACGGITERQVPDASSGAPTAGSTGGPSSSGSGGRNGSGMSGTATAVAGTMSNVPISTPPTSCFNDSDCPVNACGGEVCNWTKVHPAPSDMNKPYLCNPAGSGPRTHDGWCTTDADCKCRPLGARCVAPYCSFTLPSDAPGG